MKSIRLSTSMKNRNPLRFCLLLWLVYWTSGNLSVNRNVHIPSIVIDDKNGNKLKAEQINTKAMEVASTSAETSVEMLLQAYELDRSNWMISANLANVYSNIEQQNSRDLSIEGRQQLIKQIFFFSENAIRLNPNHPGLLNNHGLFLKDYRKHNAAIVFLKQAVNLDPMLAEAHAGLSDIYLSEGDTDKAVLQYEAALRASGIRGSPLLFKIADAMIPRIYASHEQMVQARAKYDRFILTELRLVDDCSNLLWTVGDGAFGYYLVYQGGNDILERAVVASAYRRCAPTLLAQKRDGTTVYNTDKAIITNPTSRRRRVGFVSGFFREHSVGKLIKGIVTEMGKQASTEGGYDIFVYFTHKIQKRDAISNEILQAVPHSNIRSFKTNENVDVVAGVVLDDSLDVLVFPEIGMDSLSYFLAFHRLAPVQAMFWGHPVSSGISHTIDYFISSSLFHIHDRKYESSKFIETLYYMEGLTTYFERPEEVVLEESFLRIVQTQLHANAIPFDIDRYRRGHNSHHWYVCLQSLYKITPQFDAVIHGIVDSDPLAVIILLKNPNAQFASRTRQRLSRRFSRNPKLLDRVVFFDLVNKENFLRLGKFASVALDPFPFGGGVTSLEILSTGTPIITLPNATSVLQLTLGFYRAMQKGDTGASRLLDKHCLAQTIPEYIKKAVEVASLRDRPDTDLEKYINDRVQRLYRSENVVREWDIFFDTVIRGG